jgi:hypothetical protein
MTIRVYLMPIVVGSRGRFAQIRLPKYLGLVDGRSCTMLRYGQEGACLFVVDITDEQHTAMVANADVRAFPANLDTAVTNAARTQIVNALEALNVPAHWVANGQTFRMVLRRLAGIFALFCNLEGRALRFLQSSLDSQINTLPQPVRTGMQDAAQALGLSTAGIAGTTTLRAALAAIGAQFDSRPVRACKVEL